MVEETRLEDIGPDAYFWQALNKGVFLVQQCKSCVRDYFPPALVCPRCGNQDIAWREPSGKGTVYAVTTVRDRSGDYNVSLVDLEGGSRMMSRVEGVKPDDVRIGQEVLARLVSGDQPHVVFTVAGETQ